VSGGPAPRARVWLAVPLVLGACAGGPWDVPDGDELRFKRNVRECRLLTQDAEGNEGPISFDQCMHNRGWRRMGPLKRAWKAL